MIRDDTPHQPLYDRGTRMGTRVEVNACESDLVSSAAQGDLEAFNRLVLKYQDLVYSLARSILGDDDYASRASLFLHLHNTLEEAAKRRVTTGSLTSCSN